MKTIHNGIEHGLMQPYAERFDICRHADSKSLPPETRAKTQTFAEKILSSMRYKLDGHVEPQAG